MNPSSRAERVLRTVLAEVLPPDREACLLATTLREVARQRRHREIRKRGAVAATLAVLVALTVLKWPQSPAPTRLRAAASAPPTAAVPVIASRPLAPSLFVETRTGLTPLIESDASSVDQVATADALQRATSLTDDELLALLAGQPAALVTTGGETRLVLAARSDRAENP
jgi:hypothetical protein